MHLPFNHIDNSTLTLDCILDYRVIALVLIARIAGPQSKFQKHLKTPPPRIKMAWVGNYIHNTLLTALFGTTIENHTDEEGEPCSKPYSSDRYRPSVRDVIGIKEALHKKSTLPYELVDTIVDMAEYWPHTTTTTQQETRVRAGHDRENMFIVSPNLSPSMLLLNRSTVAILPTRISPRQLQPRRWLADAFRVCRNIYNSATKTVARITQCHR